MSRAYQRPTKRRVACQQAELQNSTDTDSHKGDRRPGMPDAWATWRRLVCATSGPLRPIRRLAWGWELERAGCLRGRGFTVRTGCVGGLDCVSCVSDGLCVCSLVTLVVLCLFHLLRFVRCQTVCGPVCCGLVCVCSTFYSSKICVREYRGLFWAPLRAVTTSQIGLVMPTLAFRRPRPHDKSAVEYVAAEHAARSCTGALCAQRPTTTRWVRAIIFWPNRSRIIFWPTLGTRTRAPKVWQGQRPAHFSAAPSSPSAPSCPSSCCAPPSSEQIAHCPLSSPRMPGCPQ